MAGFGSTNSVVFSGNLGRDPDFNVSANGNSVCGFSIAISGWDNQKSRETTMWMKCVCFGKTAEFCEKHITKGTKVSVVGSLREKEWTDKDGNDHTSFEVIANDVTVMERRNNGESAVEKGGRKVRQSSSTDEDWISGTGK